MKKNVRINFEIMSRTFVKNQNMTKISRFFQNFAMKIFPWMALFWRIQICPKNREKMLKIENWQKKNREILVKIEIFRKIENWPKTVPKFGSIIAKNSQ